MSADEGRYAVVCARFYDELADRLLQGAGRAFEEEGVPADRLDFFDVPGAFELPAAARACAESGRYVAVVCLGAVIRGQTDHYDHVCRETARGIQQTSLETGVYCSFGVLTVESKKQGRVRSGGGLRDTGHDAAQTAMRMAQTLGQIRSGETPGSQPG